MVKKQDEATDGDKRRKYENITKMANYNMTYDLAHYESIRRLIYEQC